MAKMDLKEFRREAKKRRAGRARGAARYTDELKAFALEHADKAQAEGGSTAQAAADLDLCAVTLYGWQKERRAPKGELRPVVVESTPAPAPPLTPRPVATLVLRTPGGYEVAGLDIDSAAALLRALA